MSHINNFFERLLAANESDVVAIVNGEIRNSRQLCVSVAELVTTLSSLPQQKWLVWADSAYPFLVEFFALCLSGKQIVMPGNVQADYLKNISGSFDAVLADVAIPAVDSDKAVVHVKATETESMEIGEAIDVVKKAVDSLDDSAITLYTSGTTGEAKAINKTLGLLVEEVIAQQSMWADKVGNCSVVSTVGHQHIYGLLHYALWPWYRRAPVVDPASHLAEEVFSLARMHAPSVLVSSPTHLHRLYAGLNEVDCIDAASGKPLFYSVFSSAGLLEKQKAGVIERCAGTSPIEIFGSTETGGVAWRQQSLQSEGDAQWESLAGVNVSRDTDSGCLSIQSRFMLENSYLMSDRVSEIRQGHFCLQGRADRIVKVEGKRLSLDEMLAKLSTHRYVGEARLLVLKKRREEVCAIVRLSESGKAALNNHDKRQMNSELRSCLLESFELPLLPRRWRYVDEFPCDQQGKVTQAALQTLFESVGGIGA